MSRPCMLMVLLCLLSCDAQAGATPADCGTLVFPEGTDDALDLMDLGNYRVGDDREGGPW